MNRRPRLPRVGEDFADLLHAAKAEQGAAFERLYRAFAPAVAGYLRVQGSPDPDALTNEVFFDAFRALATFTGDEEQFTSWLFTIAHRRLTDERRRGGRRPQLSDRGLDDLPEVRGGDVEDDAMRRVSVQWVSRVCEGLSPDQRDVLMLRMVSGLPIERVAESLGKSPTAVKALQRRALGAVRRAMEAEGVSP